MKILEVLTGKAPLCEKPTKPISFILKDGSVTTSKIADRAVTTEKLAHETIDYFKDLVVGMLQADQNAIANLSYYECNTLGATQVKTIGSRYYKLIEGGAMQIKMAHAHTYDGNAQLKIEEEAAKTLYYNGQIATAENTWQDGETIVVYYDGQVYQGYNYATLISSHIEALRDEVTARIDTILGTDDQTEAIDTFGEVVAFLTGITNENTLQQLLGTIGDNITAANDRITTTESQLRGMLNTLANNLSNTQSVLQGNINQVDSKITGFQEGLDETNGNVSAIDRRVEAIEGTIGSSEEVGTLQDRVTTLEGSMDTKVDKETGKSLINADYAEDVTYDESLEYMKVITDANGAILWAITKTGDIKYGYGIPSDIKNYIDSQLAAEVERASSAEQLMLENRILEVYELPDASEETLDHIYILKNNIQGKEDSADKWVTVTCDGVPEYIGGGRGDVVHPVIYTSKEVTGWYDAEYENPSDGEIFLNPEWIGQIRTSRPVPSNQRIKAYVYNATTQEYGDGAMAGVDIEFGEVYYNYDDGHFYIASTNGWKKYDRSENLTLEEDIAEGNVDGTAIITTGYKWERVIPSTIYSKELLIGDNTSISEIEGVTYIQNIIENISFSGEVNMSSLNVDNLAVNAGITVDEVDLIPQQNIPVIAIGESMNYHFSLVEGERRNIFFVPSPDDVGNTQHTVNITAGGKTLTCTFQASSYCEVCATRVNDTYFLREVPAGV